MPRRVSFQVEVGGEDEDAIDKMCLKMGHAFCRLLGL
jgi:hypothetical protein